MNTDVPKGSITAINGMRTLSITWVVLGHVLAFALQFVGRYELGKLSVETFTLIFIAMMNVEAYHLVGP